MNVRHIRQTSATEFGGHYVRHKRPPRTPYGNLWWRTFWENHVLDRQTSANGTTSALGLNGGAWPRAEEWFQARDGHPNG